MDQTISDGVYISDANVCDAWLVYCETPVLQSDNFDESEYMLYIHTSMIWYCWCIDYLILWTW